MPFFSSKFLRRKTPARKKLSFHAEGPKNDVRNDPITLNLAGEEFKFESGEWKKAFQDGTDYKKELEQQQITSQALREENNLLKIKLEILLDMLTLETTKALENRNKIAVPEEISNRKF